MSSTTEVARRRFYGRRIDRSGNWYEGPILIDVIRWAHVDPDRYIEDTYTVELDGVHQCGGPARHLRDDGSPPATFASWIDADRDAAATIELPLAYGTVVFIPSAAGGQWHRAATNGGTLCNRTATTLPVKAKRLLITCKSCRRIVYGAGR